MPRVSWTVSTGASAGSRSEEHTSELQSQSNLVCRLLLEKKNHDSSLGFDKQSQQPTSWLHTPRLISWATIQSYPHLAQATVRDSLCYLSLPLCYEVHLH